MGAIDWVTATRHPPVNHLQRAIGKAANQIYELFITSVSQEHREGNLRKRSECRTNVRNVCITHLKLQIKISIGNPVYIDELMLFIDLHVLPCPLGGSSPSSRSALLVDSLSHQATEDPSALINWCFPAPDWHPQSKPHQRTIIKIQIPHYTKEMKDMQQHL